MDVAARRFWRRVLGWGLGVALLIGAVGFAARGVAWETLGAVPAWTLVWMGLLVVVNLVLSAVLFWRVTACFGPVPKVGLGVMGALISGSALLNYLPAVRAGLWGRAAYLKARHGLGVRASLVTLAVVLGVTVAVLGVVSAVMLALRSASVEARWGAVLGGVLVLSGVAEVACRRWVSVAGGGAGGVGWLWPWLRLGDLLSASGRLWLAFAALGSPIGFTEAVVMSAASLLVKLIGITPSGLGLSEWVVAALSAALTPVESATAATAALLDRAVEVVVVVPAGLVAMGWLKKCMKGVAH